MEIGAGRLRKVEVYSSERVGKRGGGKRLRLSVLARISAGFPAIAGKTREQADVSAAGFTRN